MSEQTEFLKIMIDIHEKVSRVETTTKHMASTQESQGAIINAVASRVSILENFKTRVVASAMVVGGLFTFAFQFGLDWLKQHLNL